MNLAPGSTFAWDYRIVRPLGAGGMGALFVVEQISTGQQRALKLMHSGLLQNEEMRRKFEQEARVGARIESEHVVQVVAAGVDIASQAPYLVMELLDGEDLEAYVRRRGPLPPSEVADIFEQLCHAVGAAHAAGIVHRDLKPENVFLAKARRAGAAFTVKVLDFGIAKLLSEGVGKSTAAMGSPMWLAPEQTERGTISPGADVWALGLIAFYLLTGRPYWAAASGDTSVAQLMREILFEPIKPASARAAERGAPLPPAFDAVFARSVTRAPQERFPEAHAFGSALIAALRGNATVTTVDWRAPTPQPAYGFAATPSQVPSLRQGTPALEPMRYPTPAQTESPPPSSAGLVILAAAIGLFVVVGGVIAAFVMVRRPAPVAIASTPVASAIAPPVALSVPPTPSFFPLDPLAVATTTATTTAIATTTATATTTTKPPPLVTAEAVTPTTPPTVTTSRTPADIQRVMAAARPRLRACYDKGLAQDPSLGGKIPVTIIIGTDGKVTAASIGNGATLQSPVVTTCVLAVTRSLVFPPADTSSTVNYPLVFNSSKD